MVNGQFRDQPTIEAVTEATPRGTPLGADPVLATGNGACQTLCRATAGKHGMQTIGCVEGAFEELGFDMDEGACDKLEEAMFLGLGNTQGQACLACVKASGVQDSQCAAVQAICFTGQ